MKAAGAYASAASASRQKKPAPFPVRRQSRRTFHIRSLLLPFPSAAHFIGPADGFFARRRFFHLCRQSVLCAALPVCSPTGFQGDRNPLGRLWKGILKGKPIRKGFPLSRLFVGANCLSFTLPQAAGLTRSVAPPLRVRSFDRTRFFLCAETKKWGRSSEITPHGTEAAGAYAAAASATVLRVASEEACSIPRPAAEPPDVPYPQSPSSFSLRGPFHWARGWFCFSRRRFFCPFHWACGWASGPEKASPVAGRLWGSAGRGQYWNTLPPTNSRTTESRGT